jgi:hypothetical protein
MANKYLLLLVFLLGSFSFLAQLQVTQINRDKDVSDAYKASVVDSTTFTGVLIDMNFGGSCQASQNAGIGIFKIEESSKKMSSDTIAVVIQCAFDGPYQKLLVKGQKYNMKVTPCKVKYWVDIQWDQYDKAKRFFLIGKDPVIVQ